MARVIVLGAGVSGLDRSHEVTVVSPQADYNWIPSNIWVGSACCAGNRSVSRLHRSTGVTASASGFPMTIW